MRHSSFPLAGGSMAALIVCLLAASPAAAADSWRSQSLRDQPVTGPNGIVTTAEALAVNRQMGAERKAVTEVAPGVWSLAGWGIAASFAFDAPGGWIIIDTGDSKQAAAEMRAELEKALGRRIRVAAILWTHSHYTNGTAAWRDPGTELWGSEELDSFRQGEIGLTPVSSVALSRASAQFGMFHPKTGPDAFPNLLGFGPEKLAAEADYVPPEKLFPYGEVVTRTIAGETIEVLPMRTDTRDSVAYWFPARKVLVTNFTVTPYMFNIFTLRGGRYREPMVFVNDARRLESKPAELLLDIHNAPVRGRAAVKAALERSSDQVQQIHDQTLRLIARGLDARQAAEAITMSPTLRDGFETYGQVESQVRQVWHAERGWFGNDVYDINPLSVRDEARRTVEGMGGPATVRHQATRAATEGGIDNWRWALRLTSLLLALDPADRDARAARATAARALGQRTTSANARGFYITEALEMEGALRTPGGIPVTMDQLRRVLGTPSPEQLAASPVPVVLDYLRYMVDPVKAGTQRFDFTVAVEGDPAVHRLLVRNGVLIPSRADAPAATHVRLTRAQLANLVLGTGAFPDTRPGVRGFDAIFDRSQFVTREMIAERLAVSPRDYP